MTNPNELKEQIGTQTLHMVLLSMATFGIYLIIWLIKNNEIIERITKTKLTGNTYPLWVAVFKGWGLGPLSCLILIHTTLGLFLRWYSGMYFIEILLIVFLLVSCAMLVSYHVLLVIWAFKAKKAIQEYALTELKIDLQMDVFCLAMFHLYYINYCIEHIAEVVRKHDIIKGSSSTLGDSQ